MRILGRLSARASLLILLALATLTCVVYWASAARLSMVNAGITIDYGKQSAALLLACTGALVLAGALAKGAAVRVTAALLAVGAALLAWDCLTFSVTAERDVLRIRRLASTTTLPWTRVAKLESEPAAVVFVELGGKRTRLNLSGIGPQQRAAFDRTVARRIWESGPERTAP